MELLRISDTKLKIMLSEEDMHRYHLTHGNIDYNTVETRRAIKQILKEAKEKIGFSADLNKIYIQLFEGNGGCELFINGEESEKITALSPKTKTESVFAFSDFQTLSQVCRHLYLRNYTGDSSVYYRKNEDTYCLIIWENTMDSLLPGRGISEYAFITEYGERICHRLASAYVREHLCVYIDKNAVEKLGTETETC